jgi:AcrR family transcriptional regulator
MIGTQRDLYVQQDQQVAGRAGPDKVKAERRARREERRRREILAAALRVFEKDGFEGASTRAIAREADVSEGTIYNYFPDKGELCIQALKQGSGLAKLTEQMARRDAPLETVLSELARWRAEHAALQSAQMELWAEIMARPKLRERYRVEIWDPAAKSFERAFRGRRDLAVPPPLAARIVMSTLLGVWLMSLADRQLLKLTTGNVETALTSLYGILLRGLTDQARTRSSRS